MNVKVIPRGFDLAPGDLELLRRHVAHLEKRLQHIDPDLIDLDIVLEKQPRREEYASRVRLVVMNRPFTVSRNQAPLVRTLIRQVFDAIERNVEQRLSTLRGRAVWTRKRGMRKEANAQEARHGAAGNRVARPSMKHWPSH